MTKSEWTIQTRTANGWSIITVDGTLAQAIRKAERLTGGRFVRVEEA